MIIEYFLFVQVLFVSSFQTYCIAQHTSVETRIHINQYSVLCSCNTRIFSPLPPIFLFIFFIFYKFLKDFIYLFLKRGREGKREGEKHQCMVASHTSPLGTWSATQACALTGNWTGDPLVCRPGLNTLNDTSLGSFFILKKICYYFLVVHLSVSTV